MTTSLLVARTQEVLQFWFYELEPKQHFKKDFALDEMIAARFSDLHEALLQGNWDLKNWSARECLAAIIVLDQFSRNIYRHDKKAFSGDEMACDIARHLIAAGDDLTFNPQERSFIYMPFMHSEILADQELSVELFRKLDWMDSYKYALAHLDIIRKFGRFPHRNAVLGRTNTLAETTFIETPGTAF